MNNSKSFAEQQEEAPPIFKTWQRFYMLVAVNLVVLIIVFYTFTRLFE